MGSSYRQKLTDLLPKGAQELPTRDGGVGRKERPARVIELRRWGPSFEPLDFQEQVIDGIKHRVRSHSVTGLLSLPTGAGKTLTTSWLLLDVLKEVTQAPARAIWIAPQRELLYQAAEALQGAWWSGRGPDSFDIEVIEKGHQITRLEAPGCFLMTPQMARGLTDSLTKSLDVLVFDEAHHVAANTFGALWNDLQAKGKPRLSLGLSATPTRTDETEVDELRNAFHKNLFIPELLGTKPAQGLVDKGVLAKPKFRLVEDVPAFERWKGPSDQRTLQSLVSSSDRWRCVLDTLADLSLGPTVAYALDRHHGKTLTKHLRHLGADAEYIDGNTPYGERIGVLERFRDGTCRILVNVALLIEGIDCPAAQSVFLTYPIESDIMFRQMVGRVLRGPAIGGTESCQVWAVEGSQAQLDRRLFGTGLSLAGWNIELLS